MIKMNKKILYIIFVFLNSCIPIIAGTGIFGAVMVGTDRRSTGAIIDDNVIEHKVGDLIKNKVSSSLIVSYNRIVLIAGYVSDDESKQNITKYIYSVPNVRSVINELTVGTDPRIQSLSSDSYLTSKVKTRLLNTDIPINSVKVVTDNAIVYLIGIVTINEATTATDIARRTDGVKNVIRIFEYIDESSNAKAIDKNIDKDKKVVNDK